MDDDACTAFLQSVCRSLVCAGQGFVKCGALSASAPTGGSPTRLADLSQYRAFLLNTPAEWAGLNAMCHITISRFYRDRGVFDVILRQLLPQLAATDSAGMLECGSPIRFRSASACVSRATGQPLV
jgi:chemotaxis protein methyltransferase CheR